MKYIQIKPTDGLTDELHQEIKLKAIQAGKSIPKYILECVKYELKLSEEMDLIREVCEASKKEPKNSECERGCIDGINYCKDCRPDLW